MAWAYTAASGTGALGIIDNITVDKRIKMNPQVNRAELVAHFQPNNTELKRRCIS